MVTYKILYTDNGKHSFFSSTHRSFTKTGHRLNKKEIISRFNKVEILQAILYSQCNKTRNY